MKLIDADAYMEKVVREAQAMPQEKGEDFIVLSEWIMEKTPSVKPKQEWISCRERLPETIGEYLITVLSNPHKNRVVSAGYYHNRLKEFGTYRADASWEKWDVLAWMPLPEPYEPKKKSEQTDCLRKS